jgi:hypothetical protein
MFRNARFSEEKPLFAQNARKILRKKELFYEFSAIFEFFNVFFVFSAFLLEILQIFLCLSLQIKF